MDLLKDVVLVCFFFGRGDVFLFCSILLNYHAFLIVFPWKGSLRVCVCVCVSSSVPKSDSQNGLEAITHSRGTQHFTGTVSNEATSEVGYPAWPAGRTCISRWYKDSLLSYQKIRLFRSAGGSWVFQNFPVADPALYRYLAWLIQPTAIT